MKTTDKSRYSTAYFNLTQKTHVFPRIFCSPLLHRQHLIMAPSRQS